MKIIYNCIGNNYNRTRCADERILDALLLLLNPPKAALIADIGAGTGNYSYELAKRGYLVHALEPSEKMLEQKLDHRNLTWYSGFAEAMPFGNDCYNGVLCTMATHHFSSLESAYSEIHRILVPRGRLVVFTADPRAVDDDCWLKEFFSPQFRLACDILPERDSVIALAESIFGTKAAITHFPLPHDLKDWFFYSAWRYPEKYLQDDFRNGISCFSMCVEEPTGFAVKKLSSDLQNGTWDKKYGHFRKMEHYNGGYYFLSIEKKELPPSKEGVKLKTVL